MYNYFSLSLSLSLFSSSRREVITVGIAENFSFLQNKIFYAA
jgi:hypothetical protein